MSIQSSLFSADHGDDPYASSHAGERALNKAIVAAEISRSFEEYLEIFDRFYAEDIEVSSATSTQQIRGKASVSSLLYNFLIPLHIMAEIGGVSISIRQITMPGDAADETLADFIRRRFLQPGDAVNRSTTSCINGVAVAELALCDRQHRRRFHQGPRRSCL